MSDIKKAAEVAENTGVRHWMKTGMSGLMKGGMVGFGLYFEAVTSGREYGMGYGLARGAAYSVPYVGAAMMLYDIGKGIGNTMFEHQQAKRRISFSRGFQDPFGTASTMRQRSQYNLNRGRASLGSEAFLFH